MKILHRALACLVGLTLGLTLAACGGGDSAAALRTDYDTAVREFTAALRTVVDEPTAQAAKDDLARFRSRIDRIDQRGAHLSSAEQRRLLGMQSQMEKTFMASFQPEIQRILSSPKVSGHFTAALMSLARN